MNPRRIVLAITGASGAGYGLRLAEELLRAGVELSLLVSRAGFLVLKEECGLDWSGTTAETAEKVRDYFAGKDAASGSLMIKYYAEDDFLAPFASGSAAADALVICPCTMGSLARIAAGLSGNLLERTADVMLKEGRQLLLVPRETPLSAIHLENMLKLARLGVKIVPAMPAFYHHPRTVEDQVNFVVGKVLDQLGVEHGLFTRWGDHN